MTMLALLGAIVAFLTVSAEAKKRKPKNPWNGYSFDLRAGFDNAGPNDRSFMMKTKMGDDVLVRGPFVMFKGFMEHGEAQDQCSDMKLGPMGHRISGRGLATIRDEADARTMMGLMRDAEQEMSECVMPPRKKKKKKGNGEGEENDEENGEGEEEDDGEDKPEGNNPDKKGDKKPRPQNPRPPKPWVNAMETRATHEWRWIDGCPPGGCLKIDALAEDDDDDDESYDDDEDDGDDEDEEDDGGRRRLPEWGQDRDRYGYPGYGYSPNPAYGYGGYHRPGYGYIRPRGRGKCGNKRQKRCGAVNPDAADDGDLMTKAKCCRKECPICDLRDLGGDWK